MDTQAWQWPPVTGSADKHNIHFFFPLGLCNAYREDSEVDKYTTGIWKAPYFLHKPLLNLEPGRSIIYQAQLSLPPVMESRINKVADQLCGGRHQASQRCLQQSAGLSKSHQSAVPSCFPICSSGVTLYSEVVTPAVHIKLEWNRTKRQECQ